MRSTFVTEAKNQGRQSDFEQITLPRLDVAHDLARLGMHEARPERVGHAAAAELRERARSSRPAQGRTPA